MTSSSSDSWYPLAEDYYVPEPEPEFYPVRQGDVMLSPEGPSDSKGRPWRACQVVHPSCEISAKRDVRLLQVVRVLPLSSVSAKQQEAIARGFNIVDGAPRIAWANTFFLPPVGHEECPMFSDFRQVARVARSQLHVSRRVGALTHDARVYFIRRKLYWEQRWRLDVDDVFALEADRIGADHNFVGQKPAWAIA